MCVAGARVGGPGRFIREPARDVDVVRGSDVALECVVVSGNPATPPRLTWKRRDGAPLAPGRHRVLLGRQAVASSQ